MSIPLTRIAAAAAAVPARCWQEPAAAERQQYQPLLAAAREQLSRDGIHDAQMMAILPCVRCQQGAAAYECVQGHR